MAQDKGTHQPSIVSDSNAIIGSNDGTSNAPGDVDLNNSNQLESSSHHRLVVAKYATNGVYLNYKDQTRSALNIEDYGSDGSGEVHEVHMSECIPLHEQTTIPMAEAYVLPVEARRLQSNCNIVQLDQTSCLPTPPHSDALASTGTRTTDDTSSSDVMFERNRNDTENNSIQGDRENTKNVTNMKLKDVFKAAVQDERKFWVRFIAVALGLNVLLVCGVVVAGICLSGSCSRNDNVPEEPHIGGANTSSNSTTDKDEDIAMGSGGTTDGDKEFADNSTIGGGYDVDEATKSHRVLSLPELIAIGAALELSIIVFLTSYYIRWRRSRKLQKLQDMMSIDVIDGAQ